MPLYSIEDLDTKEQFEVNMSFAELQTFLSDNTLKYRQVFTKFPGIGDSVRLGFRKPSDGFRDVLRNVKHHHKRDNINTF